MLTVTDLKTDLLISGGADDDLLARLRDAAEGFVERHTGRSFAGGTFVEFFGGSRALFAVRNFPLDAGSVDVRADAARQFGPGTSRDPEGYVVHADRGVIEVVSGGYLRPRPGRGPADWPGAVRVTYTTPAGQVPAAVTAAVSQLVGHWYRQAKTAAAADYQMLTGRTTGPDAVSYSWGLTTGLRLPPGVLQLLQPYRVPPV